MVTQQSHQNEIDTAFPVLGLVLFTHKSLALNLTRRAHGGRLPVLLPRVSAMPLTTVTVLFFTAPFFIMVNTGAGRKSRTLSLACCHRWIRGCCCQDTASFGIESTLPVIAAVLYAACQVARRVATQESAAVMTFYANVAFPFGIVLALALEFIKPDPAAGVFVQFLLRVGRCRIRSICCF